MKSYFEDYLDKSISCLMGLHELSKVVNELVGEMAIHIKEFDATVYWFGNGGSASDAEHLAAELSGRFAIDRAPLRSFALTSNSSTLTAISNDYGYGEVFARQVEGAVRPKDIVIGISTSGRSENVINGLKVANRKGCLTVAFVGRYKKELDFVDYLLPVNDQLTCHIQEAHITIGQAICGGIEQKIFGNKA